MWGIILGVLINVISAPIIFMLGRSYQRKFAGPLLRRFSSLHSILPFELHSSSPLVITHGYVSHPTAPGKKSVEEGDFVAVMKAYQFSLNISNEIIFTDSASLIHVLGLHKNIFSVSGPKWNAVTDYFIGRLGSPATFSKSALGIMVKTPGEDQPIIFESARIEGQLASTCFGLILSGSVTEQDGSRHNVLICAGRTTISTHACMLYLNLLASSKQRLRDLQQRGITRKGRWGLLLKIENKRVGIHKIEGALHESDVSVAIVRTFIEADFVPPFYSGYGHKVSQDV